MQSNQALNGWFGNLLKGAVKAVATTIAGAVGGTILGAAAAPFVNKFVNKWLDGEWWQHDWGLNANLALTDAERRELAKFKDWGDKFGQWYNKQLNAVYVPTNREQDKIPTYLNHVNSIIQQLEKLRVYYQFKSKNPSTTLNEDQAAARENVIAIMIEGLKDTILNQYRIRSDFDYRKKRIDVKPIRLNQYFEPISIPQAAYGQVPFFALKKAGDGKLELDLGSNPKTPDFNPSLPGKVVIGTKPTETANENQPPVSSDETDETKSVENQNKQEPVNPMPVQIVKTDNSNTLANKILVGTGIAVLSGLVTSQIVKNKK